MKSFFRLVFSVLLCTACSLPVKDHVHIMTHPPAGFEEGALLFIANPATGESSFSVNRVDTVMSGGATYWTEIEPEGFGFSPVEVVLRKSSGHGGGGYGFYFAPRDRGTDSFSALALFINILGEYCTGVIQDRSFIYVLPWAGSEFLVKGYGQNNRIRIEKGSTQGQYTLFINGNPVNQWEDPSDICHDGSGLGYLAVVTPLENFPSVPVTIGFNMLE